MRMFMFLCLFYQGKLFVCFSKKMNTFLFLPMSTSLFLLFVIFVLSFLFLFFSRIDPTAKKTSR